MENTPKRLEGLEGIDNKLLDNLSFIINDYIMLVKDIELYKTGLLFGDGIQVKTLYKHEPSKFPKVFELLFKGEIEEYPEELISELERLITELRNLSVEIKRLDYIKKGKIGHFIKNGIKAKQKDIGFILPGNFKEMFLKTLQLEDTEYFPDEAINVTSEELLRIMRMKN